jgi:hypothetical protein
MLVLSRYAVKVGISTSPTVFASMMPAVKIGDSSILIRNFSRGQGNGGGWPSTTGNPSGGRRSNNPPKNTEKDRDSRGRYIRFRLHERDQVDKNFSAKVTCIACGGKATIMLFENGSTVWTNGLTTNLYNMLIDRRQKTLSPPEYVAIGSKDRYYVRFKSGVYAWVGCDAMAKALTETDKNVKSVAFGAHMGSYFIVYEDGCYQCGYLPESLEVILERRALSGEDKLDLDCVSLGPDGEYYMRAKNGRAWWGGTSKDSLARISDVKNRVMFIDFADDGTFLCRYT